MDRSQPSTKKRRIRKVAPTVRELAQASQATVERRPSRISKLRTPLVRLFRPFRPIWRVINKVLGWLTPRYFINSWREVRQVTWPNRRESWRLTMAVFIFAAVFGTIVYFVDKGLDELFKKFVLK